jgi:predicted TIM-barrel fold metal-dependent hydrolase
MKRREFLAAGTAGLIGSAVTAREAPALEIIDCHTHFWDTARPEGILWPGKNSKRLYRPMLPAELKKLSKPFGGVGAIVIEASPRVEDNQWLLDLAEKEPFLLGVVGRVDPTSDEFEKHLHRFAKNPRFRGIRISYGELPDGMKEGGKLVERCQLLIDHDLGLDTNGGPDMPGHVACLAAKCPKLRIVINHAANLRIDGREPPAKWRDGMAAAANHPNVFCKVSALVEQTGKKPPPREVDYYRPVLDTLWNCFGEDRLLYGSNWPMRHDIVPLANVIGIVRDYFTAKGQRVAEKFFHDNSQAAYVWRMK